MPVTIRNLIDKNQTGREMHRLINNYSTDLHNIAVRLGGKIVPFSKLPLDVAFNVVRKIPYRRDKKPVEVVARPREIIKRRNADCKKKAILLSAYLKERNIPFRLIASSRVPSGRIHHVFPQMMFCGFWFNLDATYSHYRPFTKKTVTNAEVLK